MNGVNGSMTDPQEIIYTDSSENLLESRTPALENTDATETDSSNHLNNHKDNASSTSQHMNVNLDNVNNGTQCKSNNEQNNKDGNETSPEHRLSPDCSAHGKLENSSVIGNNIKSYCEEVTDTQSELELYLPKHSTEKQNDRLNVEDDCKIDLLLQNGDNTMCIKNGMSGGESDEDLDNDEISETSRDFKSNVPSDSEIDGHEISNDNTNKLRTSDVVIVDNDKADSQNGSSKDCTSPEIHEILSDVEDCVIDEKQNKKPSVAGTPIQLRRSSRAIKRKRYDDVVEDADDISDFQETYIAESFRRRSKAIIINDTKTLVEMAARQMKSGIHKKEPTVVIIDTNTMASRGTTIKKTNMNNSSIGAHNLYPNIVSRNTSVTPVSKLASHTNNTHTQPSILPSLTDDMFVVEAPSFIVPYVYEKPSIKPFREFVDNLGNELSEQRAKDEYLKGEKEEEGKGKKEGESESEEDEAVTKSNETEAEEAKLKKKQDRKEQRRHRHDDDMSWDGESSSESDDDIGSDEEHKTVVIKAAVDDIKDVTNLTVEKVVPEKSAQGDNYFDLSLGKFFMNIGLSLVQEFVQNDLLKQQNRKLYREKKGGHSTKLTESSIASLNKNLEFSKENNAPYKFKQQKCEHCTFKSNSSLVVAHHMETPHMKNNVYKCNFCVYESRSPHEILYHLETEHNTRGKLERAPAYHQCPNCPFEDNGKGKLARHLIPCAKKFKPEFNLAPPIEWEPPAKIPKMARARNSMMNSFHRGQVGPLGRTPINSMATNFRPRNRTPMPIIPRISPVQGIPIMRSGVSVRQNTPILVPSNYPTNNGKTSGAPKTVHQPSISITPLPRQPLPMPIQAPAPNKNSCVICEICDGYIKDLEQLRNHMQWIHKVKIHPKMIYNRPPLNCQKCQFRFFTDQGLERHLLGSHGLVTSSMQEAANKNKDAGRCPVCGRVYQWKLLNHVARDHNLTLKPAHLSYKCTVCMATFGMYKQFENHVYSAHSVVAKRVMDKGKTPPPVKAGQSLLKPLKINDEITIIPQPAKQVTPPLKEK